MNEIIFKNIEKDYIDIDERWLKLHFITNLWVSILAFTLECALGYLLYKGVNTQVSSSFYIIKYIAIPTFCYGIIILVEYIILINKKISLYNKILSISLLSVLICFVAYTVHRGAFPSLYVMFVTPLLLTAIYGKYKVTIYTAILGLLGYVYSFLFISWDGHSFTLINTALEISSFLLSLFIIFSFFIISMFIIYFERIKNIAGIEKELERHQLLYRVQTDSLTQTYNRIALRDAITDMEADKSGSNYTFVMMDIDNFKMLNDQLGHVVGDTCLIEISKIMNNRCGDAKVFRYGGDEFSILYKNHEVEEIIKICELLQYEFKTICKKFTLDCSVSLSFGIAQYHEDLLPTNLIENSDKALYVSKKIKNKITVFDETLTIKG